MTNTDYTPTPEAVERMAQEFYADAKDAFPYWGGITSFDSLNKEWRELFTRQAVRSLTRQHAREAGLLDALRTIAGAPLSVYWGIRDIVERALAAQAATHTEERWECPTCGLGVSADEDGCCSTCGADCTTKPATVTIQAQEVEP